ncbi:MAG: hypothetical protein GXP40_07230 [Chloroflexi bacterium]|nr:hypothetical protein [Chloroflexota bacterium]
MQSNIIGVRFTKIGKVYHFDSRAVPDVRVGEYVIVDTTRGKHLGEVVQRFKKAPPAPNGGFKKVLRRATPRDLILLQTWQNKQTEAMINCRARAAELKIPNVKIVAAEFNYDGSRLTYLYSSEGEEKVDLKALRQSMQKKYAPTKVEMRQIGPRDVAKILGGMGACGMETRCCSKFLTEFSPISIKMAKGQGISLSPSEITGMCGRLRCCLLYEYEAYVKARKTLPKRKKRVVTPQGEGKVIDVLPLTGMVVVQLDGEERGIRHQYRRDEIEPWDEREALRRKAAQPCDKHENGDCDCGKNNKGPSKN